MTPLKTLFVIRIETRRCYISTTPNKRHIICFATPPSFVSWVLHLIRNSHFYPWVSHFGIEIKKIHMIALGYLKSYVSNLDSIVYLMNWLPTDYQYNTLAKWLATNQNFSTDLAQRRLNWYRARVYQDCVWLCDESFLRLPEQWEVTPYYTCMVSFGVCQYSRLTKHCEGLTFYEPPYVYILLLPLASSI